MSLKFKRNLPLLLALVLFLSVLAVLLGNQPVIAYTVNAEAPTTVEATVVSSDTVNDASLLTDFLTKDTLQVKSLTKGSTLSIHTTK
jgi:hypothetical protein